MMKKKIIQFVVLTLCVLSFLILAGCGSYNYPPASDRNNIGHTEIVKPLEYGNGVYYFPEVEARFGNSLAVFIAEHDELEFVSAFGDGRGNYGAVVGYFVIFRRK